MLLGHRNDERGIALSTPIAMLSAAAVVAAGLALVFTGGDEKPVPVAQPVTATPSSTPTVTPSKQSKPSKAVRNKPVVKAKKPAVRRGATYVEVYNNSGIAGLAGRTSGRIAGAGWQVVGSDNWYGTIPATTVYFPQRLTREAELLAKDLGIERLKPSIAPMRLDRLTVILTSDFS